MIVSRGIVFPLPTGLDIFVTAEDLRQIPGPMLYHNSLLCLLTDCLEPLQIEGLELARMGIRERGGI